MVTPVVPNSTNDWQARNNLRNMEVSASSITNSPQWSRGSTTNWRGQVTGQADQDGKVAAYQAALKNDQALQQVQPGLAAAAMRENADLQREGMQQQGANTRSLGQIALEQQKVNQAAVTQGIDNRSKTIVQALQSQIATEPDSAKRQSLAQRLRELQGQGQPAEWGVQVTPTTKNIDGSTSMGSIVRYNKATGQTEVVGQGQSGQSPYPDGQRLTGKDGKAYVVRNGVPVPA
jgi:hypothetical protein